MFETVNEDLCDAGKFLAEKRSISYEEALIVVSRDIRSFANDCKITEEKAQEIICTKQGPEKFYKLKDGGMTNFLIYCEK